jgi:hypothetical protein
MPYGVRVRNGDQKLQIDGRARCLHRLNPSGFLGIGVITDLGADPARNYGRRWRARFFGSQTYVDEYFIIGVPLILGGAVDAVITNFSRTFDGGGFYQFSDMDFTVRARNSNGTAAVPTPQIFTFASGVRQAPAGLEVRAEAANLPAGANQVAFDSTRLPLSIRSKHQFGTSASSATIPNVGNLVQPAVIGAVGSLAVQNWQYYVEPDPPFTPGGMTPYTLNTAGGWTLTAGGVLSRDPYAFPDSDPFGGSFVSNGAATYRSALAMIYDYWRYA